VRGQVGIGRSPGAEEALGALLRAGAAEERARAALLVSPPPPRTKWTRRVPHPVLIGHAASLSQVYYVALARSNAAALGAQGETLQTLVDLATAEEGYATPPPSVSGTRARAHVSVCHAHACPECVSDTCVCVCVCVCVCGCVCV